MAGGSIQEVTLDGRIFAVAADADSNRNLGGFSSEYEANGDGSARRIMTRGTWMLDGLDLSMNDDRGDHEYVQALMDSPDDVPITITYVTGITYSGAGNVTGDLNSSSKSSTLPVTLKGPGKLEKQ
jgi:hypothetical protein